MCPRVGGGGDSGKDWFKVWRNTSRKQWGEHHSTTMNWIPCSLKQRASLTPGHSPTFLAMMSLFHTPLTPSHLINGRKISLIPNDEHFEIICTHNTLSRRKQHHKWLLEQFAKQWKHEYLLSLRERPTTKSANGNPAPVRVGDIVILKNDSTSRAFWKLAKVEELLAGNDGKIIAAIVKVPRINRKSQLLKRVIQYLIPIEVQAESTDNQVPGDSSVPLQGSQPLVNSNPPTGRPGRNAAVRGEILRRELSRLWLWDYLTTEVRQKWGVWESFDWHFYREHFVIPYMAW